MIPEFTLQSYLRGNLLECSIQFKETKLENYEIAYYLYCDETRIKTSWYAPVRTFLYALDHPGKYKVEAFISLLGQELPLAILSSKGIEYLEETPPPFMKLQAFLYEDSIEATALLPNHNALDYLFAFRIYKNDTVIHEIRYSHNENMIFTATETGEYFVECCVAKEAAFPFFSQKSALLSYQVPADVTTMQLSLFNDSPPKRLLKKIILGAPLKCFEGASLHAQYMEGQIACKLCGMGHKPYAAYFVLLQNGKTIKSTISLNGHTEFTVQENANYLVKCFIRTLFSRSYLQTSVLQMQVPPISKEEYQHICLEVPSFVHSTTPFVDFSVISVADKLDNSAVTQMEIDGFQICRQTTLGNRTIYLVTPKDFKLDGNILLSGYIYERVFIYGQEFIGQLPSEFLQEKDFTEMTGSFTAVKYQNDSILLSTDLFGAGHLYVFEDETTTIISNRLHLTLLKMQALQIRPAIDVEYIASNLCFSEKMISVTNFSTDMVFKGLRFLPLNQYIRLSAEGTDYHIKAMTYEQIPYQEKEYRKLLDMAYNDITQKVNALEESNLFKRYIQEVTGGFDSRVALAATLNSKKIVDKMRIRTVDVSTSKDLLCSLAQTNYYNLSYYVKQEDPVKIVPVTLELKDDQNRSLAMGTYCSIGVDPFPYYLVDTPAVCFGGYFGETMRSRYFGVMQDSLSLTDSAQDIAHKFVLRVMDDAVVTDTKCQEQFATRLQQQIEQMPGHTAVEKFDNMYTFFHLRYHFGLNEYQTKVTNMIRLAPFMSKYMLYASKMLSLEQRFNNKIMYEMAHWLRPEIIAFPYSSYGLEDEKIQLDRHKQNLLLKEPKKLHVDLDFGDHNYQAVAQSNKEFSRHCDEQLAQTKEGAERRNATRFVYLRILKMIDVLEQQVELSIILWSEIRTYTFINRHDNVKLQPLYCKLMGIYDQINIVLQLLEK